MASTEVTECDNRAPKVRHLVYNMYRKMLNEYNDQANDYVDSLPKNIVEDGELYKHIENLV